MAEVRIDGSGEDCGFVMRYASHWQCHAGHSHYRHSSELLQVCATGSAVTMSVTGQRRHWQYYGSPSHGTASATGSSTATVHASATTSGVPSRVADAVTVTAGARASANGRAGPTRNPASS